jgi:hypothetical protein
MTAVPNPAATARIARLLGYDYGARVLAPASRSA